MEFTLSEVQQSWRKKGAARGRELPDTAAPADVIMGAARVGLLDPDADLLAVTVAVEAMATESPGAATAFALHSAAALSVLGAPGADSLFRGETVAGLTLATDTIPTLSGNLLSGHASWVAPITDSGVALIGVRGAESLQAALVPLDHPTVSVEPMRTAALHGFTCGHVTFRETPCSTVGATVPVMTLARTLIAAVGLGIGRRAVREALACARGTSKGAGGEQTVQGLIADAATELDAAMLLTWKAAVDPSLARASMAKLAATDAAQHAVVRATQVVGADSFRLGHIIEQLAQDVRALELFAGRTEALREAVAEAELPRRNG